MPKKVTPTHLLTVPINAQDIENRGDLSGVKVLVVDHGKPIASQTIKLNKAGQGKAEFKLPKPSSKLAVYFGPANAEDDQLLRMETLKVSISQRQWRSENHLVLKPIRISPYFWNRWLFWCRTFVITGKVVCPDGSPVPGATVCAYDVDAFWWWSSEQKVACATTNANGVFKMKFTWCCGWLPFWWWRLRKWYLNPKLAELIQPHVQLAEGLGLPMVPKAKPSPDVFERVLDKELTNSFNLETRISHREQLTTQGELTIARVPKLEFSPQSLVELREPLLKKLPESESLKKLKLWPWYPFFPWNDCSPDIIFKVTQDCGSGQEVLLNESFLDARWNISTYEQVVLNVGENACCIGEPEPDPDGYCALVSDVCSYVIDDIGGNAGAPPAPAGYLNPGLISNNGDRAFAGSVTIGGQLGLEVDYYDFEFSDDGGTTWSAVPVSAMSNFSRRYWVPAINTFQNIPFRQIIDGQMVYETRHHFEQANPGLNFGVDTYWTGQHLNTLMPWNTTTPFLNGLYDLRLRGYRINAAGQLIDQQILPVCSTQDPNHLVLRIDNRRVGAGSGHPLNDPNRPCGAGTVHLCTLEPDTEFIDVRIRRADGTLKAIGACTDVSIEQGDLLEVDFVAYDPEGHLRHYSLTSHYGLNQVVNLLAIPGRTLVPLPGGALGTPAAAQVGPTYANARVDLSGPAPAPTWQGGAIRLTVDAATAFPETCCYQLKLRAWKRTIVNCNSDAKFHNTSEISFMVQN